MSDRILVMRRGRLVAELDAKSTTQEEVLTHAAVAEVERSELEESSIALK
jgi:ABC-type sugar transport system ATPase subunit